MIKFQIKNLKFQTNYNIQNPKSQTAKIGVLDLKHCNLEFVWNLVLGACNFRRRRDGFTLIELIIYLGILSIILVSMSYLMLDILGGQTKIYGNQDVNQNLRFISNYLIKDIRAASDINSLSADTLVLVMPGEDITYNFDSAEDRLTRQLGSNEPVQLNSDRVEITGNFSDLSYLNKAKEVGVYLVIFYKNPDNLPDYNASTTSAFSVGLRGRR
ncbi:MAG: prepilin-type N-terminal cleavage/methylation domain-containing protein [Patescibacteria group bacterium]|jgi:prepilin-type N-terminal cleavage/methylation domain-containing protein